MHFQLSRLGAAFLGRVVNFTRRFARFADESSASTACGARGGAAVSARGYSPGTAVGARGYIRRYRFGFSACRLFGFSAIAAAAMAQTPSVPVPLTVLRNLGGTAPGYLFYTQQKGSGAGNGPVIADSLGRPVWFSPLSSGVAADFRVQSYQGKPVLTWATAAGFQNPTSTAGVDYIADTSYNVIATVRAGNGLGSDPHEFELTPDGTALVVSYHNVPGDVSSVGGAASGLIMECVLQEIDIATGAVLLEWHSLGHVGLDESYITPPTSGTTTYDYFHINSAKVASDGNLLVSARNTWTLYKLDRHTGEILWRLGGKKSDFALGAGLPFGWQHDALDLGGSTLQLFDNGSGSGSRALWVTFDAAAKTAAVTRSITHPENIFALAEGSTQSLPNGNTLVSFGIADRISEFDPAGTLIFDASLPSGYSDYRVYKFPWAGHPTTLPTVAAYELEDGTEQVHAIWNGATDVASWNIIGAEQEGADPIPLTSVAWNGFDTATNFVAPLAVVRVEAVDASGAVIATSDDLLAPFPGIAPTISVQPTGATVAKGGSVVLSVAATNAATYQWYHSGQPVQNSDSGDVAIAGATTPRLLVRGVGSTEGGPYRCVVSNSAGSVSTSVVMVTVSSTAEPGHLINVSCRANVTGGENALIAGFVVSGTNSAGTIPLSVQAMGRSLATYGVPDALADLRLDLYSLTSEDPIASAGANVSSAGSARSLRPQVATPATDPVLRKLLGPAAYTANVTPVTEAGGVALVQVDDNSVGAYTAGRTRLINVSGRAHVGTGADVLIAGFVIGGSTARTVLIRAAGPTLEAFGVGDELRDPQLDLYTLGGGKVASNRNWQGDPLIANVADAVGAFAWPNADSHDAALLITLPPGAYTAQVSGADGEDGVALLEVYEVP